MFLPSGRVHALGAGLVIFEVQQNSDTTYRVFDWNRVGLDGKPRALHVEKSLASINFGDFEPPLIGGEFVEQDGAKVRLLVNDLLFKVEVWRTKSGATLKLKPGKLQIIASLAGTPRVRCAEECVQLAPGEFCLLPASLAKATIETEGPVQFLRVEA